MHGNITYARLPVSPGWIPVRTTLTTLSEIAPVQVYARIGGASWLERMFLDYHACTRKSTRMELQVQDDTRHGGR